MAIQSPQNPDNKQNAELIYITPREKEVLRCLAKGDTNPEIATTLGIDECTARQHLQNLTKKLGLSGRGKLQAWAWKNGFGEQSKASLNEKSADPHIGKRDSPL